MENIEINIKSGLDGITFGSKLEDVIAQLGDPEDIENIDMDDENTTVLNYWDMGLTLFFEDVTKPCLSCIEISNKNAILFGKKIFSLSKDEIILLMKENGHNEYEVDTEVWGEERLTYEDLMIDFYFEDKKLSEVSWGNFVNVL